MPKIITDKNGITIQLEGVKKFLSLKGEIKIPWKSLTRISYKNPKWLIFTPKMGTNLPAIIMAGTFFRRKGHQ